MTTAQMITELRQALGNRTDISDGRYANWLSWAQYDLCGFNRRKLFPSIRFRQLEHVTVVTVPSYPGLVSAGTEGQYSVTLTNAASSVDSFYNSAVLQITYASGETQNCMIIAYNGTTRVATLDRPLDDDTSSATNLSDYIFFKFYTVQQLLGLDPAVQLWAVERLEDARTGQEIERGTWETVSQGDIFVLSSNIERFATRGDTVVFGSTFDYSGLDYAKTLRVWWYGYPALLSDAEPNRSPEIPEAWHETIILGAIWRGFERLMEPDRADVARVHYIDSALNRLNQYMVEENSTPRAIKVRSYRVKL